MDEIEGTGLLLLVGILAVVFAAFTGGYFVHRKIQNDSSIAHDTHRIAVALERGLGVPYYAEDIGR